MLSISPFLSLGFQRVLCHIQLTLIRFIVLFPLQSICCGWSLSQEPWLKKNGWNFLVLPLVLEYCWETKKHSLERISTFHLLPLSTWGIVLILCRLSKGFKGLFGLNKHSKWGWRLRDLDGGRLLSSKQEQYGGSDWGHQLSYGTLCSEKPLFILDLEAHGCSPYTGKLREEEYHEF